MQNTKPVPGQTESCSGKEARGTRSPAEGDYRRHCDSAWDLGSAEAEGPWPVRLSGQSVDLQTEGLQVPFWSGARTSVAGSSPAGPWSGCMQEATSRCASLTKMFLTAAQQGPGPCNRMARTTGPEHVACFTTPVLHSLPPLPNNCRALPLQSRPWP